MKMRSSESDIDETVSQASSNNSHVFSMPKISNESVLEIRSLDNQTKLLTANVYGEYNVASLEPGIYLYSPQLPNARHSWDYFLKLPLQYVNTDDYNPVKYDISGHYYVDISLLDARVKRLDIYNELGNKVLSQANMENVQDKLIIEEAVPQGNYTIMIVTEENEFPLKFNPKYDLVKSKEQKFIVYRNGDMLHINALAQESIDYLELFDLNGKVLIQRQERQVLNSQINIREFSSGTYLLRVNGNNSYKVVK